jgi:hypothetical protein
MAGLQRSWSATQPVATTFPPLASADAAWRGFRGLAPGNGSSPMVQPIDAGDLMLAIGKSVWANNEVVSKGERQDCRDNYAPIKMANGLPMPPNMDRSTQAASRKMSRLSKLISGTPAVTVLLWIRRCSVCSLRRSAFGRRQTQCFRTYQPKFWNACAARRTAPSVPGVSPIPRFNAISSTWSSAGSDLHAPTSWRDNCGLSRHTMTSSAESSRSASNN